MNTKFILGFFILSLCFSCGSQESKDVKAENTETIESKLITSKPISDLLVGTNVWYINPSEKVWDLTEASGVTSIRIGGHAYDKKMPSNETLIEWVTKIQSLGAEPIMQVSQYDSPEAAANLVKLFNVDLVTGKAIKYWNIGNEPWLQNKKPDLSTVGAMVEAYFKPRAVVMKATDPAIKIYGPDFCYYIEEAVNDLFGGKNDISGKVPGQDYYYCDGISWHRYPQDENINLAYEGIEDFRVAIETCKAKVDSVNTMHKRTGDDALGWGIGEFNAKGGPQVHTWENGQMFGGIYDLCMKYEAKYATSWSMYEHGGDRKGSDFSFIDGKNMAPRASYRHMQMIAEHFTGSYVEGKSSLSDIITFGAVDGDRISVMIMNRRPEPVSYSLHLNTDKESLEVSNTLLTIDANGALSLSGDIEGLTTQTIVFEGEKIFKISYSKNDFDNELPPTKTELK